jgi:ammonia channel protein AmtB
MERVLALVLVVVAGLVAITTINGVLQLLAVAAIVLGVVLVIVDVVARRRNRSR